MYKEGNYLFNMHSNAVWQIEEVINDKIYIICVSAGGMYKKGTRSDCYIKDINSNWSIGSNLKVIKLLLNIKDD